MKSYSSTFVFLFSCWILSSTVISRVFTLPIIKPTENSASGSSINNPQHLTTTSPIPLTKISHPIRQIDSIFQQQQPEQQHEQHKISSTSHKKNVYRFELNNEMRNVEERNKKATANLNSQKQQLQHQTFSSELAKTPTINTLLDTPKTLLLIPKRPNQKVPLPTQSRQQQQPQNQKNIIQTTKTQTSMVSTVSSTNEEKNWLLTKAWLIDNINRLRRELSQLERDYSQHLDRNHQENVENQKQLVEDVAKLRADHQFLSQQQKQILFLIKKTNYFKFSTKLDNLKFKIMRKMADAPTATSSSSSSISSSSVMVSPVKKPAKRAILSTSINNKSDQNDDISTTPEPGKKFETETRRNMKEVFNELSSLHDISLILFDSLKNMERKMEMRDKFSL